ncbi:MAG: S8 family serine peptidase [Candidatus Bipolaricaulia bacterium]
MRPRIHYAKVALVILGLALAFLPSGAGGRLWPEPQPPPKPLISHNPKIETALELALIQAQAQGLTGAGRVPVSLELIGPMSPADLAQLSGLSVAVEAYSANLVRALLPADKLGAVAKLPQIAFIRRPYKPVPLEEEESLGPIGAVLFHAHKFKGQGTRVAVIDVGFAGLSWAIAQRVLPQEIIADATDYTGEGLEGGTNHGTAVAELVHSVAPEALLYLKKIGDEVGLANALDDSLRQGVQIIVHSVGWFNTNFTDGTGIIDELADRARRAGILWVNAAGNHAQQHWAGPFRDGDGDGWIEFQGSQEELKIQPGFGELQLFLTWNDWPRTCQDYDLFLYNSWGELVASSQNYQTCSEPPTEELDYLVLQPGIYYARVLARNRLKPGMALKIFSGNGQLEPAVPQGSLPAPADAKGVLAVGAIPIGLWESGPPEPFSSQGPTSDGRVKPEIMAPDNVRTATEVGFLHCFQGTSAAAPQVAGAAALLLSQHPNWTATEVWAALEASAIDMGPPGKDNLYGAGRLNLSLGRPRAVREIKSLIRPGDQVVQGDSLLVSVRLVMPPSRFGGLVFREQIPPGFRLVPLENAGAEFDPTALTWTWPIVDPGSGRTISYRLIVPPGQLPGDYRLEGQINGAAGAVEGEAEFRVIRPLTIPEAVAHWDEAAGLLDLEREGPIEAAQLERALRWWLEETPVPGTGGKLIDGPELLRLIAYHLTRTSVEQLLPSLSGWEVAQAERGIIPEPEAEGALTVTVEVEARARIYGLRLSESWPRDWQLEPLESGNSGGAIFKGGGPHGEWLWPRAIEPGEQLRICYRLRPLGGRVAKAHGLISSALPQFSYPVEGAERAELAAQPSSSSPLDLRGVGLIPKGTALELKVLGQGIAAFSLQIYDLAGRRVYASGWVSSTPLTIDSDRARWANGVYLYLLKARGADGKEGQRLGKLVLLR